MAVRRTRPPQPLAPHGIPGHLVEFVEYPREVHPFMVGTQAHPELKSRPTRPHPLFSAFVRASLRYKAAERLPVNIHPDDDVDPADLDDVTAAEAGVLEAGA